MDTTDLLTRFGVALAIGLLFGLERGWKTRDEEGGTRTAGFRTFALSGLLGGVAGALAGLADSLVLGAMFLGFAGAFVTFAWLEANASRVYSVTTVIAGLLAFALGAYAVLGDLLVAIAAAVSATALLALRQQLHAWVASLQWEEIRATLILLAMTFLLLPVLPREPVDPWSVLNLYEIWLFAVMIAAISFGGYIAVRIFGERLGVLMAAVAGGVASSTATTLAFAKLGKEHPGTEPLLSAGILISSIVMALRVAVIASLLNPALLAPLVVPVGALAAVLAVATILLLFRAGGRGAEQAKLEIRNPLALGSALQMAAFIAIVTIAAELAHRFIGGGAVLGVAALSGIADVDAVTVSMARRTGALGIDVAGLAILIAVAVNTVSKAVLAAWSGGRSIGIQVGVASAAALLGAGLLFFLVN
jgi:uncharacterized membrane protein (DUF4010 family)